MTDAGPPERKRRLDVAATPSLLEELPAVLASLTLALAGDHAEAAKLRRVSKGAKELSRRALERTNVLRIGRELRERLEALSDDDFKAFADSIEHKRVEELVLLPLPQMARVGDEMDGWMDLAQRCGDLRRLVVDDAEYGNRGWKAVRAVLVTSTKLRSLTYDRDFIIDLGPLLEGIKAPLEQLVFRFETSPIEGAVASNGEKWDPLPDPWALVGWDRTPFLTTLKLTIGLEKATQFVPKILEKAVSLTHFGLKLVTDPRELRDNVVNAVSACAKAAKSAAAPLEHVDVRLECWNGYDWYGPVYQKESKVDSIAAAIEPWLELPALRHLQFDQSQVLLFDPESVPRDLGLLLPRLLEHKQLATVCFDMLRPQKYGKSRRYAIAALSEQLLQATMDLGAAVDMSVSMLDDVQPGTRQTWLARHPRIRVSTATVSS